MNISALLTLLFSMPTALLILSALNAQGLNAKRWEAKLGDVCGACLFSGQKTEGSQQGANNEMKLRWQ